MILNMDNIAITDNILANVLNLSRKTTPQKTLFVRSIIHLARGAPVAPWNTSF